MSEQGQQPGRALEAGDRVRVIASDSEFTGCRGCVATPPSQIPLSENGRPLGYYVAIDGENGRIRPFLTEELEQLHAARVRPALESRVLRGRVEPR